MDDIVSFATCHRRVWSRAFDLVVVEVTVRTLRVASLDSTPLSTAYPITPCTTLLAFFADAEPCASATRCRKPRRR